MTLAPRSLGGRIVAVVWLVVWAAILVFAFVQRHIHDTDIAVAYFLLFLSFPLGYLVAGAFDVVFHALYEMAGVVVPGGFIHNFAAWLGLGAVGYLQWFFLVPWCIRNRTVDPDARKGDAHGSP